MARENDSTPTQLFEGYPEDVEDYLLWYLDAFWRLSNSRATTMGGIWYIPLSEILYMAQVMKFSMEKTERFIDYIQVLDDEYVNFVNDDGKGDKSKKSDSPKKQPLNG